MGEEGLGARKLNIMRKYLILTLTCIVSIMISSCNETTVDTTPETSATAIESSTETSATTSSEETTVTTTESTTESTPETTNKALLNEKYKEALTKLRKDLIWPVKRDHLDNNIAEIFEGKDVSENSFAIADIDCDGTDELIIKWTAISGMSWTYCCEIFEYDADNDQLRSEGYFDPFSSFYDNGIVTNPYYRNMDYGEVTWPYSIHKYDHENDKYYLDPVGDVVCFDREYLRNRGEYIPSKKAKRMIKKDGVVYLISYPGYDPQKYYSKNEYNTFWQKLVGNAKQIKVKYYALTKKNINKIASVD